MKRDDKLVKLFRVQDRSGCGMYSSHLKSPSGFTKYESRHPLPHTDSKLVKDLDSNGMSLNVGRTSLLFGFKNRTQLKRWLPKALRLKLDPSYVVVEMVVPRRHIAVGDTQVVFNRRHAKIVSKTPLHEFD